MGAVRQVLDVLDTVCDGFHDPNEDTFHVTPQYAWVLDGASRLTTNATMQVAEYVLSLDNELRTACHMTERRHPNEVLRHALERLQGSLPPHSSESPTAAIGIIEMSDDALEFLINGDISVVVQSRGQKPVRLTDLRAWIREHRYSDLMARLTLEGNSLAQAREAVTSLERRQRTEDQENASGALRVGVDPRSVDFSHTGHVRVRSGDTVLMASDGFMRAVDLYKKHTLTELMDSLARGTNTLRKVVSEVRTAECDARTSLEHPSISDHDDATAVLLRIREPVGG